MHRTILMILLALIATFPALALEPDAAPESSQAETEIETELEAERPPSLGFAPDLSRLLSTLECVPTTNFEQACNDGIDNDCDGLIDFDDPDCYVVGCPYGGGGDVGIACCANGVFCQVGADCCSGFCRGKPGAKTCR